MESGGRSEQWGKVFGVCVVHSDRELSVVSCWRKLGLEFRGNREPQKASELKNEVKAAIVVMAMVMITVELLTECLLFANSFSNYFTHRTYLTLTPIA